MNIAAELANRFQTPWVLGFLILPLIYFIQVLVLKRNTHRAVRFSGVNDLKGLPITLRQRIFWLLPFLRMLGLSLLIVAAARPRLGQTYEQVTSEGVDIMLTLDISGSMQHLDLLSRSELNQIGRKDPKTFFESGEINKYSRLGQAKKVIDRFIDQRKADPMGLVIFAGRSMTRCPLTVDHGVLKMLLTEVDHQTIPQSGTAVGDALMTSIQRLKESKAKSKVVVLLTDGANNAGRIHPEKAAAVAKAVGIKVYTIGLGRKDGKTLWFGQNPFTGELFWTNQVLPPEEQVDEESLVNIAKVTGGKYYRAVNVEELEKIYEEIDALEKTEIETYTFTKYHEKFFPWLLWGSVLLLIELFLSHTWLRRLP